MLCFPLTPCEGALILNGQRTPLSLNTKGENTQHWSNYHQIVITDGAWDDFIDSQIGQYVQNNNLDKLTVLGDGDSILNPPAQFIFTPNQDYTDFEKGLHYMIEKDINSVDVFWGSGGEMDHFLGNLSVAAKYAGDIRVRFVDANQSYVFLNSPSAISIDNAKGKTVSLYPFPEATLTSKGLAYPLNDLALALQKQQSLRNQIMTTSVKLELVSGDVWIFVSL